MHHTTFDALGTRWWIEIFDDIDEQQSSAAFGSAALLLQTFDSLYSRFKPESLITKLNHERELKNPDKDFVRILEVGKNLYDRTNRHFNILIGQALEARGYDTNYSFQESGEEFVIGNPNEDLIISPDLVELKHGNIDNGGYGKGYAVDKVAELLLSQGIHYFLINAGGDIYVTSENGNPIEIHLEHPTEANKSIGTTTLLNEGFAASSPFRRQWTSNGKTYSHIIGESTEQFASFVKAPTACDADAFATAALLANTSELQEICNRENINIARFSPTTGKLWSTPNFSIQANVN